MCDLISLASTPIKRGHKIAYILPVCLQKIMSYSFMYFSIYAPPSGRWKQFFLLYFWMKWTIHTPPQAYSENDLYANVIWINFF